MNKEELRQYFYAACLFDLSQGFEIFAATVAVDMSTWLPWVMLQVSTSQKLWQSYGKASSMPGWLVSMPKSFSIAASTALQ
jgi:hypothetical protein